MNPLLRLPSLVFLGLAILAVILREPPIAAMLGLSWGISVVYFAFRMAGQQSSDQFLNLNSADRNLVRPLLDLRNELKDLTDKNRDLPTIGVVGTEAVAEADRVVTSAVQLVQLRATLRREPDNLEAVDGIGRIDLRLQSYTEALRDVRTRLALEATKQRAPSAQDENEMDGMMSRLRSLSISVDEAGQALREIQQ